MTFEADLTVLEIKADFDQFGNQVTMACLGYRLPKFKSEQEVWKHALHIIIPKEQWNDQYKMWELYHGIINDDGSMGLEKK